MANATVTYKRDDSDLIEVAVSTGHKFQFGGRDGDGFCYSHQSFDCVNNLTPDENKAIDRAIVEG